MVSSYLQRVIDRCRFYSDEPSVDAKYSDGYIATDLVPTSAADVLSRINNNSQSPIVLETTLSIVEGTKRYKLPACVGEVWALEKRDTDGNPEYRIIPRTYTNPNNQGYRLEGNELVFPVAPVDTIDLILCYLPAHDFMPHKGTCNVARSSGVDTVRLGVTTTLGSLDNRDNAYGGAVFRLFDDAGVVEERTITRSYFSTYWYAELSTPLSEHTPPLTGSTYEVFAPGLGPLVDAIALECAMKLGVARSFSQAKMTSLEKAYRVAMKTAKDHYAYKNIIAGRSFDQTSINTDTKPW